VVVVVLILMLRRTTLPSSGHNTLAWLSLTVSFILACLAAAIYDAYRDISHCRTIIVASGLASNMFPFRFSGVESNISDEKAAFSFALQILFSLHVCNINQL
jgi:uncharacterized membrane protein